MKAASVEGKGRFEIEEIPKPEAGPGGSNVRTTGYRSHFRASRRD